MGYESYACCYIYKNSLAVIFLVNGGALHPRWDLIRNGEEVVPFPVVTILHLCVGDAKCTFLKVSVVHGVVGD